MTGLDNFPKNESDARLPAEQEVSSPSQAIEVHSIGNSSERVTTALSSLNSEAIDVAPILPEPQILGFLTEMSKQIPLVTGGVLPLQTFQEFVDHAKKSGVPIQRLRSLLESHGVGIRESDAEESELDDVPLLPSGKRATWVRIGAQLDVNGDFPLGISIDTRMSRPRSQPLWNETESITDDNSINFGINIPLELDLEARKIEKEEGDSASYLDFIGNALGWKKDEQDGWFVPADLIEKLTREQATQLIKKSE